MNKALKKKALSIIKEYYGEDAKTLRMMSDEEIENRLIMALYVMEGQKAIRETFNIC